MILNSPYITGSLTVTGNIIASGSITLSGSVASASFASTASNALTLQGLGSASFAPADTFNTVSQSFASTSGSVSSRVTLIEGQYATTGSNIFSGTQRITETSNAISFTSTASLYTDGGLRVAKDSYVSGTAYFNNVTVYGTQSVSYITSSQLNITDNIISVNTFTPAIRFGGLAVYDSGSTGLSGSMLWDSEQNRWVYSNPSGSSYDGGMIISGPRNTTGLGNEQGTLSNYVTKGQGGDHITSSQITDDGTTVRIPGSFQVTGSIVGASNITADGTVTINGNNALYLNNTDNTTTSAILNGGVSGVGQMLFYTGGSEKMRITSGGTLAIGMTTAPYSQVSIRSNSTNNYAGLNVWGPSSSTNFISLNHDNTKGIIAVDYSSGGYTPLTFYSGGSERVRIATTGHVLIGTTTDLGIWSSWDGGFTRIGDSGAMWSYATGGTDFMISNNYYISTSAAAETRWATGGASNIYFNNGNIVFRNAGSGAAGSTITWLTSIKLTSTGNVLVGSSTGDGTGLVGSILMGVGNAGSGQENKQIMYVNNYSSGTGFPQFVGNWMSPGTWAIGPDTGANDSTLRVGIASSNSSGFYYTGTYVSLKGASFPTTSDYRIKTNVEDSTYGIESIMNLRPIRYNALTQDDEGNQIPKLNTEIGFIAHEVQEVIPEVVTGTKDAVDDHGNPLIQSVEYSRLTAVLVKAIQEQQTLIESLTSRIEQLESK